MSAGASEPVLHDGAEIRTMYRGVPASYWLGSHTTATFAQLCATRCVVALLPIGSVEPHGPHLGLATDAAISEAAAERAAAQLADLAVVQFAPGTKRWCAPDAALASVIAPTIPYGVTECAAGFAGAVSLAPEVLTAYVTAVATALLRAGAQVVCLVNNHLEPAHDAALRAACGPRVVLASPLTRRWGRTLSAEYKRGECHAGEYETSMMLAAAPTLVNVTAAAALPTVPVSLSQGFAAGKTTFAAMGMTEAYAGSPATATAAHGQDMLQRLAEMIIGEVADCLAAL